MKYEMKECLASVLPGYLLSLVSHLLGAVEAQLQRDSSDAGRAYTALDHDNTPLKRALDMLRVVQQGLVDRVHGMSPEEQLALAYFIYTIEKSLIEYRGSLEQLQTSHKVATLTTVLLSMGRSPQEHDSDWAFSYDEFFLVVSALSSMIYKDGVVFVQHPIVMEAFAVVDARLSDPAICFQMYGHPLIAMALKGQLSHSKHSKEHNEGQISDVEGEWQTLLEVLDEDLYLSEEFTSSPFTDMKEGIKNKVKTHFSGLISLKKRMHFLVETLDIKGLLGDVRDSYKKFSSQCDVVVGCESITANEESLEFVYVFNNADTCNTISEVPMRKENLATDATDLVKHLHYKVSPKNLLCVKHESEYMEFVLDEKAISLPKQSVSSSYMDNVDLVSVDFSSKVSVVHLDQRESVHREVIAKHGLSLPPPPNPTRSWCWKRRIKPLCVANMKHYISKASRRALEEHDKECNETICHAIVAVFDPKSAVTLVRALKCQSLDVFSHRDKHGNTPLHNAVMTGNVAIVQEILGHLPAALHTRNNDCATPVDVAMHLNYYQIVKYLVHQAVQCGPHSTESIELLQCYLLKAMKIGYIKYLRILLELHTKFSVAVDFECTDSDCHTAWHYLKQKEPHVQSNAIEILKTSHLGCALISLVVGKSWGQTVRNPMEPIDSVTVVKQPNPDDAVPPLTSEPVCSEESQTLYCKNGKCADQMPMALLQDDGTPQKNIAGISKPIHLELAGQMDSDKTSLTSTPVSPVEGPHCLVAGTISQTYQQEQIDKDRNSSCSDENASYSEQEFYIPAPQETIEKIHYSSDNDMQLKSPSTDHNESQPSSVGSGITDSSCSLVPPDFVVTQPVDLHVVSDFSSEESDMESHALCFNSQPQYTDSVTSSGHSTPEKKCITKSQKERRKLAEDRVVRHRLDTSESDSNANERMCPRPKPSNKKRNNEDSNSNIKSNHGSSSGVVSSDSEPFAPQSSTNEIAHRMEHELEPLYEEIGIQFKLPSGSFSHVNLRTLRPVMISGQSICTPVYHKGVHSHVKPVLDDSYLNVNMLLRFTFSCSLLHRTIVPVFADKRNAFSEDTMDLKQFDFGGQPQSLHSPHYSVSVYKVKLTWKPICNIVDPSSSGLAEQDLECIAQLPPPEKTIGNLECHSYDGLQPNSLGCDLNESLPPSLSSIMACSVIPPDFAVTENHAPCFNSQPQYTDLMTSSDHSTMRISKKQTTLDVIFPTPGPKYDNVDSNSNIESAHSNETSNIEPSEPQTTTEKRADQVSDTGRKCILKKKQSELINGRSQSANTEIHPHPQPSSIRCDNEDSNESIHDSRVDFSSVVSSGTRFIIMPAIPDADKLADSGGQCPSVQKTLRCKSVPKHRKRSAVEPAKVSLRKPHSTSHSKAEMFHNKNQFKQWILAIIQRDGYNHIKKHIHSQWYSVYGFVPVREQLTHSQKKRARIILDVVQSKKSSIPKYVLQNLNDLKKLLTKEKSEEDTSDQWRGRKKPKDKPKSSTDGAAVKPPHETDSDYSTGTSTAVGNPKPFHTTPRHSEAHHRKKTKVTSAKVEVDTTQSLLGNSNKISDEVPRQEESAASSVLGFANANSLQVIRSHLTTYSKCCPRHDIQNIVVVGTTCPASDAFGPKRRYSSIKDIKDGTRHTPFNASEKLNGKGNSEKCMSQSTLQVMDRQIPENKIKLPLQPQNISSHQQTQKQEQLLAPPDHKERLQSAAELLHAQDYPRILPLSYEGKPPTSLAPLVRIPYVFITALAYYKMSNHKQSVQHFQHCLQLAQECNRLGDVTLCNIYIGDIEFAQRKYIEAANKYRTALDYYDRDSVAKDFRMILPTKSAVWSKCGSAFKNASRMGDSVAAYERAIEVATSMKDKLSAHTSLGNLYQGIGENGRAVKEYEDAIALATELKDNVSLGWNHGNLGNALLGLHQRDKALHHLFKALDMAVDYETTPQAIGRAYNNLGTAFQSLSEHDKAEEYYDLALAQAIYGNDVPGQARVYGNIGNLQMLKKHYDRAVPHYTEVMRLSQDKSTITTAHHNRGCAYYDWAEEKKNTLIKKTSPPVSTGFKISLHGQMFEQCEEGYRPPRVPDSIQKYWKYYLHGTRDLEYVIKHHEENFSGIKGSPKGLSLSVSLFETNSRTFHRMQDCLVHLKNGDNQPSRFEDALLFAEHSRARTLGELLLKRRGPQLKHQLVSPPSLVQLKSTLSRTMGIFDQLPAISVTIPVQYQQMLCVVGNPTIPPFKYNNDE